MPHIGALKPKTNLYRLLRRVEAGEQFVITKHGRPVAELTSFRPGDPDRVQVAIDEPKAFRRVHRLDGLAARDVTSQGRRH